MKVGFAGSWDPSDKTIWSGIYFNSYQAIKKYYELETFYFKWPWHVREALILHKQIQKLGNKKANIEFLRGYAKYFSKQLEKELLKRKVDLLFIPSAPQLIAYCKTDIPIIYLTDTTFSRLHGYYPLYTDIARYNISQGLKVDKLAFQNATHCILASDWAMRSAMEDYEIPANKITIVPFGANLDTIPPVTELRKEKNKFCQLLFLGVEWERKGGQIALDTFYTLQKKGMPVQLTIIGCVPPVPVNDKNITVIPFLNKNNKEESTRLYDIFLRSDLLLLPTRAECAGIVFCEAGAFGVPSITTNTGGVSSYVQDGVNGFTLPMEAGPGEYAAKIRELFANDDMYKQLSAGSRKRFEEDLNWDNWGRSFHNIAENILNK